MQQTTMVLAMLAIGSLAHAQGVSADWVDSSVRSGTPKRNRVFGQGDKMRLEIYDEPGSPEPSAIMLTDFSQQRADVQYEDFKGHKLDRKMLELVRGTEGG